MNALGRIAAIAGRELAAFVLAPIAYVVGVLFLIVQGFSFWAVVQALSDPRQPAPLGAVMHTFVGGSLPYWAIVFVVIATAAMRLMAEERRLGTWEALCATPATEAEIAIGKWLGALGYYLALWLPTLAYPAVLYAFAPPGAAPALAPIAAAYLGIALAGGAMLAVALAAGAGTGNQIVAAVSGFVALLGLLVVGELPELLALPALPTRVAAACDLRGHAQQFARGVIDAGVVAFYVGLAIAGLAFATALASVGRRPRGQVASRIVAAGLIALIAGLACALLAPRAPRWDVTPGAVNSLAPVTRAALAAVDAPVEALVIRAGEPGFGGVYDEAERILSRMARAQPRLSMAWLDPALEPARLAALADAFALSPELLLGGGAVVFRRGERRRAVELLDMASFGRDAAGGGQVASLVAEAEFVEALVGVLDREQPRLCTSEGHGELEAEAATADRSAFALFQRLARDGARLESVAALAGGVPARCQALLILGPRRALDPAEAAAVAEHLERGGRLLLAVDAAPAPDGPGLARHGLELVLARYGVRTPDAIVVHPDREVGLPFTWATYDGYAAHPITAGFVQRRATVWPAPRLVVADAAPDVPTDAVALVSTSAQGWAEVDVAGVFEGRPPSRDADDRGGPVPVAVAAEAGAARLVVLGSARALAADFAARELGDGGELAASATAWLLGRVQSIDLGERTPEQVRLVMGRGARRAVAIACVGLIPLAFAALGAVLAWRRRRG